MKEPFFKGKRAIVTGAASGIGLEYCRQLSAQGCSILMVDCSPLEEAISGLAPAAGAELFPLRADLTREDALRGIISWIDENDFRPDLLVNNAGIFDFKPVCRMSGERLQTYVDLHVRAVTMLCRAVCGRMLRRGGGRVINMSSMSCWMPMPGIAMYSATKAYIRVFSRALADELAPHGVKVLVACPGGIATDLFGLPARLQRLGGRLGVLDTPQRLVSRILKRSAVGRRQYINGWLNRLSIVFVGCLPDCLRRKIGYYAEKRDA